MKHVVILGAGISGLATAWYLKEKTKSPLAITILEKSDRVGGWIHTIKDEGLIFETGPRGFRPKGKGEKILALVQSLNLQDELLSNCKHARKRYILIDKKLSKIPSHPLQALFSSQFRFLIPLILKERKISSKQGSEESIADFFRRRFSQKMIDLLIDPFVTGIFGGDPEKLSMEACLPSLVEWEHKYGSVVKGIFNSLTDEKKKKNNIHASLCSFKNGLETLPIAIAQKLQRDHVMIYFQKEALSLAFEKEKIRVLTQDKTLNADFVISALPLHAITKCLPSYFSSFQDMELAPIAVINFGYSKRPTPYRGYGYLIPSNQKEPILGVTFDSDIFPEQDLKPYFRYTVMLGGSRNPSILNKDPHTLVKIAADSLENHLKIQDAPSHVNVSLHHNALAQYSLGHIKRLAYVEKQLPQNFLCAGNHLFGMGIADCIERSEKVANLTLYHLAARH